MRTARFIAGVGLAAMVATVAAPGCSSGRPGAASDLAGPVSTSSVSGSSADSGVDGTKPPGCGTASDGTSCGCTDVPLFIDPPNMYYVLDHSGSMQEGGKWDSVRKTVGELTRQVGQRANFGAMMFPGRTNASACVTGAEVMSIRPGDPPSSSKDGPTTTLLLTATNSVPNGGTPTAATMRDLSTRVKSFSGKTFFILATDGGPNCDEQAACDASACIDNIEGAPGCTPTNNCCALQPRSCLDADPTRTAIAALQRAGYPTYVIGIPGSAPYASLLDDLAVAGGTAQATSPKYYRVDSAGQADLLKTLRKVAAKIVATCTFKFKETPPDPELVNVYLDEKVLVRDPVDGWTITGDTVTLVGNACASVTNGDVLGVRIIAGCPSVVH